MKIAFIHYHLKTGGVTTVIRQQVDALAEDCRVLVISGGPPEDDFPADVVVIPELAYTTVDSPLCDPGQVAASIMDAIRQTFKSDCDVVHVHNPTLAKNRHLLEILKQLRCNDANLFLQIHDFAEDGRPSSYTRQEYPANCHYGVLTSRDHRILLRAGLQPQGVHLVPNMVAAPPDGRLPARDAHEDFILYPIRAIRRKNIGEAILLSLFLRRAQRLVITLPPNSPADIESYQDWKSFAGMHGLAVEFDTGLQKDFETLIRSARYLITTSITEGFGFSFIEPWVYGKLLRGRNLPNVTRDFEQNGLDLGHLYRQFEVPLAWIDPRLFLDRWRACIQRVAETFDFPIDAARIKTAFEEITAHGCLDFGLLHEDFQKQVIMRLLAGPRNAEILRQLNPFLAEMGDAGQADALIGKNRQAAVDSYGRNIYRRRLLGAYSAVRDVPLRHRINKHALLSEFIDLNRFSFLKWGSYHE
jgi:hypothetical protein